MELEKIDAELRNLAFEFFYWFSRFEFALKENRILHDHTVGARAEPGWNEFVENHEGGYTLSTKGAELIRKNPKRQIVGRGEMDFAPVPFDAQATELRRVVTLLKTVRNNLFHGGKHGAEYWDDPENMKVLLSLSIGILDELAELGEIESDYKRFY